jgi:hypothetical protein
MYGEPQNSISAEEEQRLERALRRKYEIFLLPELCALSSLCSSSALMEFWDHHSFHPNVKTVEEQEALLCGSNGFGLGH